MQYVGKVYCAIDAKTQECLKESGSGSVKKPSDNPRGVAYAPPRFPEEFRMFTINQLGRQAAGFTLVFANGYTVSVQWGSATYSSNRDKDWNDPDLNQSNSAEVAVWGPDGAYVRLDGDDVAGYLVSDEVARLIAVVAAIPQGEVVTDIELDSLEA